MNETYLKDYFEGRLSSDEEKMLGENIENDPEASPAEHVIASLLRGRTFAEKRVRLPAIGRKNCRLVSMKKIRAASH